MNRPILPRPIAIPVDPQLIPSTLIAIPHWLIWRYEWRTGKWTKVPYTASASSRAKSTDPRTWSHFEVALKRWQAGDCDGIGFALTRDLNITGLDVDHVRDPETGEITIEALEVVNLLNTYTEVSPSGTGLRSLAYGKKPAGRCKRGNYEMYQEGRYLSITGSYLMGTPRTIELRQAAILTVHAQKLGGPAPSSHIQLRPRSDAPRSFEDDCLLERAFGAKNRAKIARLWSGDTSQYAADGNAGRSEADSALCFELAFWTQDPVQLDRLFRRSGLFRDKWDERHYGDGRTYGEVTIARALAQVRQHWTPLSAPLNGTSTSSSPKANTWEGTNTLLLKPYVGYRGLRSRMPGKGTTRGHSS